MPRLPISPASKISERAEHVVGGSDADRDTADARRRYDRASRYYDFQVWPMELMGMRRFRRQVLSRVLGPRVLEIGVGTGINLPDYAADLEIDAIDLSPRMLERARRRQRIRARVHLHEMDAQKLAFPDALFNTVVTTCVFCSVPDPILGLMEVRRVLRPYGHAVLLEHVRPGGRRLGALFDRLDPFVSRAGPHINRRTVENIRAAGLTIEAEQNLFSDIVKLIVARP
jgi:ubiquinone/menaquinone biosynthesis C-methylase UbiE